MSRGLRVTIQAPLRFLSSRVQGPQGLGVYYPGLVYRPRYGDDSDASDAAAAGDDADGDGDHAGAFRYRPFCCGLLNRWQR